MPVINSTSFDVVELKRRVDLLDLVSRDIQLKRVGSTHGGEYAGPCPFCGGSDRFRVQPDRGIWWCRQCSPDEHWSDSIGYVMHRDNLTFPDACRSLGADPTSATRPPVKSAQVAQAAQVDDEPPPAKWQEAARAFVTRAEERLWSTDGERALAYLRERRGLTDGTIRRWRLGWNPTDVWREPPMWGLEWGADRKKIWLPRGIVIPAEADGHVWRVKVRRARPGDELTAYVGEGQPSNIDAKYLAIRGSRSVLFGSDNLVSRDVLILAEGEFDAILLSQVGGDLIDVATLGSASDTPSGRRIWPLLGSRRILVAYDLDAAGEKGAGRLAALSGRVRQVRPIGAHDLTSMYQAGGDLRSWLSFLLAKHSPPPPSEGAPGTLLEWTPTEAWSDVPPGAALPPEAELWPQPDGRLYARLRHEFF